MFEISTENFKCKFKQNWNKNLNCSHKLTKTNGIIGTKLVSLITLFKELLKDNLVVN